MSEQSEHISQQLLPAALEVFHGLPEGLSEGRGFGAAVIGGAAVAFAAFVAGDELLARRQPVRTTPYLEHLPAHGSDSTAVVTFYEGGFNSHPRAPGHVYGEAARDYGPMFIIHDPETGYDPALTQAAVAEKCDQLKPDVVVLHGDSAGGKKQLTTAAYLINTLGIDARVVQVSTPNHRDHIKGWHRQLMLQILEVADRRGIRGGQRARRAIEMIGFKIDNPGASIRACRNHIRQKFSAEEVATSPQTIRYASLLRRHDSAADLRAIDPERIQFVGADDPERDPVVYVDESHAFLEQHTGGTVRRIRHPKLKHANTCEDTETACNILHETYAGFKITSTRQRRMSDPIPRVA